MDKRFAKFTEVTVNLHEEDSINELMLDVSAIIAIRGTKYGTEIITKDEDFCVKESFSDVRKILAI